jgi:Leucine-rich repeat (LRR) protein
MRTVSSLIVAVFPRGARLSKSRKPNRWRSFSLRTILIAIFCLAVWLAWLVPRAERQRKVANWIRSLGSQPYYEFQRNGDANSPNLLTRSLSRIAGLDYVSTIDRLQLAGNSVQDIEMVADLPNLRWCELQGAGVTDLGPLQKLKRLEFLFLGHTQVDDLSPVSNLTSLKRLEVFDTKITDLTFLRNLKQLTSLNVMVTSIDDISPLQNHPALTKLNIASTNVSDVSYLSSIKTLKYLDIYNTKVSPSDADRLQAALPNCKIRR